MIWEIVKNLAAHENNVQDPDEQQKFGVAIFAAGVVLSALGEIELIAILLKLPFTIIPKLTPTYTMPFLSIFYLILGNCMMLIEYQFFRKKNIVDMSKT